MLISSLMMKGFTREMRQLMTAQGDKNEKLREKGRERAEVAGGDKGSILH